ncbi:MAG: branched-chain amino acid ABC transporter permease [Acidimicrobiales bacterium]
MIVGVVLAQASASGLTKLVNTLWDGFALGALYALLALGFVIIFKATQVVNFAHGAIASVGAYFVATFAVEKHIPGRWTPGPRWLDWSLSVLLALIAAAIIGLLIERLTIRPMIGEPLFSVAIITLGLDIVLRSLVNDFLGTSNKSMGSPFGLKVLRIGDIRIPHTQIVSTLLAFAAFAAVGIFFKSRMGVAMRSTAFDQEAALCQGIKVGRVFALAWAIGAVLATLAGTFAAIFPRGSGNLEAGTAFFALRAFPAVILGGLDSVKGAIVGGFLVGTIEIVTSVYLQSHRDVLGNGFQTVVPYVVMLVGLLIRPYGLFGTVEVRRV